MLKVHYHSDCIFFAGCENMLANFFNSKDLRSLYDVTFSYRYTEKYEQGLKQRLMHDLPVYPLILPDVTDFRKLSWLPVSVRRLLSAIIRLLLTIPFFIYEVIMLQSLFKKLRPDILHINNGGYPAALSARAATVAGRLAGVPKVLMVVNNMAVGYRHYSRLLDFPIDRLVVSSVDRFVTGSYAAGERLQGVLCLPSNKIRNIHNGIAVRPSNEVIEATRSRLGLNEFGGVVFGVVALLVPRKGHQVLLDAVLMLVEQQRLSSEAFKVFIEGNGPLRQSLVAFIEAHKLEQWVKLIGVEENVMDFMRAMDVIVLPSVADEDFPNVILEAMALRKPVIASRLAGTPEQVLNGETGLLFEPGNATQLSEAMALLLSDLNRINDMGCAAFLRFEKNFTVNVALDKYMNEYQSLWAEGN